MMGYVKHIVSIKTFKVQFRDTVLSRSRPKSHAFNKESVGAVKNQDRLSKTINSIVRLARIAVSGETNPT